MTTNTTATMTHKDFLSVLDFDAVADEGVALDLAAGADDRTTLDLDERSHLRLVADRAAVQIRERAHDDSLAERDVVNQPIGCVVRRCRGHR